MAPAPSDRAQREAAADPRHSIIIQAPAGSGKTELLVRRFLGLLGIVDRPQRVLAITFTRKATQEMAERIVQRLAAAEAGEVPRAEHERISHRLALQVLRRDRALGWNLLHNPAQLQIHTIDGLCARIAARGAEPGAAAMRIAEQPQALYEEAARRVIERVAAEAGNSGPAAALEALLLRLRGNLGLLQVTLVTELGRRDQWLGQVAGAIGDLPDILALRQEEELEILERCLGRTELRRLAEVLAKAMHAGEGSPDARGWNAAAGAVADAEDRLDTRVRFMRELLGKVATGQGRPMAPSTVRRAFKDAWPGDPGGWLEEIVGIVDGWRHHPQAAVAFERWIKSPPVGPAPGDDRLLASMYELLREACAELRVLFSERGVCDFQHVAELAMAALGDDLAPGAALLLEDGRLEHILVDEFQDTSRMQYDFLRRLTSGWARGDGRTLFLVGDPMQSIYRFRKADVALFQRVFDTARLGGVDLQTLRLKANFRSCREIVEFANLHFPAIFTPTSPAAAGSVQYVPFIPQSGRRGRVAVHPNPDWIGADGEADQVAELVARLASANPVPSIGILARKRESLEPVAAALARRDVDFEALDVQSLSRRPVIGDLLALTRVMLHPGDRIAWLTLLHAPWCGLAPAELQAVAGEHFEADILDRMGRVDRMEALGEHAGRRVALLHEVMQDALEAAGRQELHRRVEAAWIRLQAPCALSGPLDLADAQAFLDLLARVEAEQHDDPLGALDLELARLRAAARPARIQLMTIHKAKGLEFDAVVLTGMDAGVGGRGLPLFRQHHFQLVDGRQGSLLAPVKAAGDPGPSLYQYLGRLDSEDEADEAQRVLYVALTRARRELHLFGRWQLRGSGAKRAPAARARSFMQLMWGSFEEQIEPENWRELEPQQPDREDSEPIVWPQLRLVGAPEPVLVPERADPIPVELSLDRPDPDAQALGAALHLWLELIHDHRSDRWLGDWFKDYQAALESSLAHAGARPDSISALSARLYRMLQVVLGDTGDRARIRPSPGQPSHAEAAFYLAEGLCLNRNVLDRLIADGEGGWRIIDYKTGAPTPDNLDRWSRQLDSYRRVVSQAGGRVSSMQVLQIGETGVDVIDIHPLEAGAAGQEHEPEGHLSIHRQAPNKN